MSEDKTKRILSTNTGECALCGNWGNALVSVNLCRTCSAADVELGIINEKTNLTTAYIIQQTLQYVAENAETIEIFSKPRSQNAEQEYLYAEVDKKGILNMEPDIIKLIK